MPFDMKRQTTSGAAFHAARHSRDPLPRLLPSRESRPLPPQAGSLVNGKIRSSFDGLAQPALVRRRQAKRRVGD